MNVNVNPRDSLLLKRRNVKKHVRSEIQKLLESSEINEGSDEITQFLVDYFIVDQFRMQLCNLSKKKRCKKEMKRLPGAVPRAEKPEFQSSISPQKMVIQGSSALETAERRNLDMSQNKQPIDLEDQSVDLAEINTKEVQSLLKEGYAAYRNGRYCIAAVKYKAAWEMITNDAIELHVEHIQQNAVCYMLSLTLVERGQLNNLSEAMELLIALEKRSSRTFPAVYLALSKVYHKHYRFELALKEIEKGFAILGGDGEITRYAIPGSDVTLEESTREGLRVSLAAMEDECSKWHPPDAVCCVSECLSGSHWYGPNRNIYFSDPAFNGMVVLTCSNARNPCIMKFHHVCWKSKKDELSALKKLSDKEVIGYQCFTPNCESDQDNKSQIIRVEVYGDDGKLKTQTEAPLNPAEWGTRQSISKGAIPKQQAKPKRHSEKTRKPVVNVVPRSVCKETAKQNSVERASRMAKLLKLRKNNFGIKAECKWRPDLAMYGNPQMMEIGDFLGRSIFENSEQEMVEIKTSIFMYFYKFIEESGCVKKEEISQKWEEERFKFSCHSDVLHPKIHICDFLLQSYKIVSIGDYIGVAENLPELYAVVKNEVCGCLRFLLVDPVQSSPAVAQDYISKAKASDDGRNKVELLSAVVVPPSHCPWLMQENAVEDETFPDHLEREKNTDFFNLQQPPIDFSSAYSVNSESTDELSIDAEYGTASELLSHETTINQKTKVASEPSYDTRTPDFKPFSIDYRSSISSESEDDSVEPMKDLIRLQAQCAHLETEKSNLVRQFQESQLDLSRARDENVSLQFEFTKLKSKYDKIYVEKMDIEHNFNILSKEKRAIENDLQKMKKERDELDEKLQKHQASLKSTSRTDPDIAPSSTQKKIGTDVLIQELKKKFIGIPSMDLINSLQDVRELHNGTLSGMRLEDIIRESEPFIRERQKKHMAFYSQSEQKSTQHQTLLPQPNASSQPKLPLSTAWSNTNVTRVMKQNDVPSSFCPGKSKKTRGFARPQGGKIANYPIKAPPTASAGIKKQAWGPASSGLANWLTNEEDPECVICYEIMNSSDAQTPIYVLRCQHTFHTKCLKKWFREKSDCPKCRTYSTMDSEFPPLPSQSQ